MPRIVLPLDEMTLAEKLELAETRWTDLADHHADNIPSPEWHAEVLRERQRQLDAGEDEFLEWDEAQREIDRLVAQVEDLPVASSGSR